VENNSKLGLVLSGGGARGAYQVGVLKAIAELQPKRGHNPFSVITGTSAGAINAVSLASSANNFRLAVKKLEKVWRDIHVQDVYDVSGRNMLVSTGRLIYSLFHQGASRSKPLALLNTDPLRNLLSHTIQFKNISRRIESGYLDAVAVTASGYTSSESVTFYQAHSEQEKWSHGRRRGIPSTLTVGHLLASSAIPTLMPAEKLSREYFGDGALRQLAPLSPALQLGAEKILVIGVSGNPTHKPHEEAVLEPPSMAQMISHIFNSAFIDSMENDLEHLIRINDLVGLVENENPHIDVENVRPVDLLLINPSIEFDKIAEKHIRDLPYSLRTLMRVIGATKKGRGASLASYLLFESEFCMELIQCGYEDAMEEEAALRDLFIRS
jgi:NTE family protein